MENQLYVRIRGRILGPYDKEKLQSLARRGQLSRMHELSSDSTNWVRASTYPELFVGEDISPTADASQNPRNIPDNGQKLGQSAQASKPRWWYGKNGAEAGPVDQATLQQMLSSGSLSPDDRVWTEGMAQWIPAKQVPGLMPATSYLQGQPNAVGPNAVIPEQDAVLSASLCKSSTSSRPWVLFITIVFFIFAGFDIVAGIFWIITGSRVHASPIVAAGFISLICSVDFAFGGFLLLNYASRMASLTYSRHALILERSLDSLRSFWIFISINLIIALAFLIFVVVWVIAVGCTWPPF